MDFMTIEPNYSRWKAGLQRHGDDALAAIPPLEIATDTIHVFPLGPGGDAPTLDVLARSFGGNTRSHFLVVFSAALGATARTQGSPPYFSGDQLAATSGLPLLAISDPTLAMDNEIRLAWYVGNHATGPLFGRIADVIDALALQTGKTPILVGGSGGGYAALSTAHYLRGAADVVVSNPQTCISRYMKEAGHQFLKTGFGVRRPQGIPEPKDAESLQALLDDICPEFDTRVPDAALLRRNKRVFYLQNISDHAHVKNHARPYFDNESFPDRSGKCFVTEDGRMIFFPGEWGQGHAKTPMGLLAGILEGIVKGESASHLAKERLEKSEWAAAKPFLTLLGQSLDRRNAFIQAEKASESRMAVALSIPYPKRTLEYAFYLRGPDGVLHQVPYQKSAKASFELVDVRFPALLTVFAKDNLGVIKTVRRRIDAL
ncbi:hypothetical protein ODI_R3710 [Orrella dioscoreae]|uniref:Uncharacterized protein n=2 Tax=Orrella dioscoreae TaxID=1851544 RepID=A0A1C3JXU5_9BURK|nr:hypothetical protein ODI_03508 [Orrella dioscoreae]SOE51819.1 hypothetical protein ODI_R3710 [Orrella dioscoreae]